MIASWIPPLKYNGELSRKLPTAIVSGAGKVTDVDDVAAVPPFLCVLCDVADDE
jgi:hypothetical protein